MYTYISLIARKLHLLEETNYRNLALLFCDVNPQSMNQIQAFLLKFPYKLAYEVILCEAFGTTFKKKVGLYA